jgi:hypothetical protein
MTNFGNSYRKEIELVERGGNSPRPHLNIEPMVVHGDAGRGTGFHRAEALQSQRLRGRVHPGTMPFLVLVRLHEKRFRGGDGVFVT